MRLLLALLLVLSFAGVAKAQPTDLNIITAIDLSDSVSRDEERFQYDGFAAALVYPEFVAYAEENPVSILVFGWSSGGEFRILVPWTRVDSAESAQALALYVRNLPSLAAEYTNDYGEYVGSQVGKGSTATGEALEYAIQLALTSPNPAGRDVINILTDGESNDGPKPGQFRDLAQSLGITINAVLFADTQDKLESLRRYFRDHVITGLGSFALGAADLTSFVRLMERKLHQDMVAGAM